MSIYVIKSIVCLFVLFGFYKLSLERVKMPHINRYYLLGSLGFAILVPFITFSGGEQPIKTILSVGITPYVWQKLPIVSAAPTTYAFDWLTGLYILGVMMMAGRFVVGLLNLRRLISRHTKIKTSTHTKVLLPHAIAPYSFLRYIFLTKQAFEQGHIAQDILLHEQAHVQQKHSIDILLLECLHIFFWWNPVIYYLKKAVKLNHEFLADHQVLRQVASARDYQILLLDYAGSNRSHQLVSSLNYSSAKKRILMMSQSYSKKKVVVRLLILVPVLVVSFLFFNKQTSQTISSDAPKKMLDIRVGQRQIMVNGIVTTPNEFSSTLDKALEDWTKKHLTLYRLNIQLEDDLSLALIRQLNEAARKTKLADTEPNYTLIPPKPSSLPTSALDLRPK